MKFFTNLISTAFYCEIKSDKNIIEIAEFIIHVRGYKKLKQVNKTTTYLTRFLQHIWCHPNFLVSKSTLTVSTDDETHRVEFKVFHPIPILIFIGFCALPYYFKEFHLISIAFFFILSYLVYNNLNQRVIMKEIIKEIEK
jgi:hypothetical protein